MRCIKLIDERSKEVSSTGSWAAMRCWGIISRLATIATSTNNDRFERGSSSVFFECFMRTGTGTAMRYFAPWVGR